MAALCVRRDAPERALCIIDPVGREQAAEGGDEDAAAAVGESATAARDSADLPSAGLARRRPCAKDSLLALQSHLAPRRARDRLPSTY